MCIRDRVFSGDWSEAWNGIVDAFGGIFSLIADIAKGPIKDVYKRQA